MSSPTQPVTQIELPPSVQALLRKVRLRLRRDAAATGALLAICFAIGVFWLTTTLDVGWFQLQRLELPVGLRAVILAMLLPTALWLLVSRILSPLFRRVHDLDLALLVERRFPQFQDRLITSVESARGLPSEGPLALPMLQRSVREADSLASKVASDEVFDASNLKRLAWLSGGLAFSVALLAFAQPQVFTRWWNAFVRCDEIYHVRTTDLAIAAIAQPDDRRVEFKSIGEQMVYRHPRGGDLELEIMVPDDGPSEGQSWVVPDRVRVDIIRTDGSRSRTYVSASAASDRKFRFVVTRLQEPVEIELLAGDFRTRSPYRVEVVNPPGLDSILLKCNYPEYTGWNQLRETSILVTGSEVQLPIGTTFELTARSSKTLRSASIVSDQFELFGDRESSRLMLRDGRSVESNGLPIVSSDGQAISARFEIVRTLPESASTDLESSEPTPLKPGVLQIPASANLRFSLHDDDDVKSASPASLRVQGLEDKPPIVVAQMTGIDNAVTRLAKIPITGRIRDDYGLKSAGFEFLVDDQSNWRPRPFRSTVTAGTSDFSIQRSETEPFEIFDVQVLELSEGQRVTLSVVAADSNVLPGPGMTRSEPMLFRIVSIEELLSLLYTREIALRGRFEEVIKQLEEMNSDLEFHLEVGQRVDSAGAGAAQEDRVSLSTCATRSGNNLRRQTNELNAIVEGFEEVVRQLVNNAVPPQQLAENMRSTIVNPLKAVTSEMMPIADNAVSEFRVAAQDGRQIGSLVAESRVEVGRVIASLKVILENVRDMAEFHEALRDLKAILDEQQKNLEQTKKLQRNQLIDDILK